jgi:hypothetical protein
VAGPATEGLEKMPQRPAIFLGHLQNQFAILSLRRLPLIRTRLKNRLAFHSPSSLPASLSL